MSPIAISKICQFHHHHQQQHKLRLGPEDVDDEVDVLLVGDDDVVDGATAVELLHLVSCLPADSCHLWGCRLRNKEYNLNIRREGKGGDISTMFIFL